MMKQIFRFLLILMLFSTTLSAQVSVLLNVPDDVKLLKVGEKVPDYFFSEIHNYKIGSANLSELYQNKLLILDFWSTWCAVCIAQFPKIEELQKKFGDKILILPVGFDATNAGSIKMFLNKRKGTPREMKLPTTIQKVDDTLLLKLFPCQSMPHEVWISGDGTLLGITDQTALTASNIQSMLDGKSLPISNKKTLTMLDQKKPFLIPKSANGEYSRFGSLFANYIDTLVNLSSFANQYDSAVLRFVGVNKSVFDYYSLAYKDSINESPGSFKKRIVMEGNNVHAYKDWKDAAELDNWQYDDFARKNLYCYELILPRRYPVSSAYQTIIQDMDRFFHFQSKIEKRKVTCYSLVRTSTEDKIYFDSSKGEAFMEDNFGNFHIAGFSIKLLVSQLNSRIRTPLLFVNGTDYKGKIDIKIPSNVKDLQSFKMALNKYDLDLVEEIREMPMLVLKQL